MGEKEQQRYIATVDICPDCCGYGIGPIPGLCKRCSGMGLVAKAMPQKEEVAMPEIEQRRGKFWAVWDAENGYYDLVDSRFKPVDTKDAAHKAMEKLALLHPERKLYLLAIKKGRIEVGLEMINT